MRRRYFTACASAAGSLRADEWVLVFAGMIRGNIGRARMIHPVILSGGSGTRLWPMSRTLYPKQLLALFGHESLLQQAARRVAGRDGFAPPLIVANEEHRFIIAEQLRETGIEAQPLL